MKKILALAALVLGLASCQTEPEGLNVNVGGEVDTTITVTIPDTETRAGGDNSAKGVFDNGILGTEGDNVTMRYIFQVYYNSQESLAEPQVKYSDGKTVNFDIRLVPGRNYTFVVWADVVTRENAQSEWTDLHYNTKTNGDINLANITVNESSWIAMDESRDAFTVTEVITDYNGQMGINLKLKRALAKLRVITTDMKALNDLQIEPTYATVAYSTSTKHYSTFNAVDGSCSGEIANKTHNYFIAPYADHDGNTSKVLFTDYFFANKQDEVVNFTLNVYDKQGLNGDAYTINDDYLIKTNNFNTPIPAQRNYLTTIQGNVLTDGNNVTVTVEDAFANSQNPNDKPYYNEIVEVGNATDLQEAINESTENTTIVLGGDIDLGDLFGATRAAATLPIVIPEGKVVALDLNGFNLTTPFVEGSTTNHAYAFENRGSLTIQDSKGNGQIIARGIFNYGTMTLKSGTINACDGNGGYGVRNYEGEFIMNGGSIVTSNEDDNQVDNGGYDATTLRIDEGATATINGGTINNISDYTFAIENYGETVVNGGTFTSIHSTVSSYGDLTINGGSFTCNGLEGITAHALVAWDGSETTINGGTFDGKDNYNGFNVDAVSGAVVNINGGKFLPVHSGSLYGDGTIIVKGGEFFDNPSARVAEGYKAVEQNGIYTIAKDPAAMIGSEVYLSLQAAIEAVQDGETIVLQRDVNIATPAYGQNALNHARAINFTLDLNGKTISADTGNSVFRYNISQTDATSNITVTFMNGTITSGDNTWCTVMAAGTSNDVKAIFNLENLTINASKAGDLAVKAWDYAVINAKNVTVNATKCTGGFYALGGEIVLDNCTVNQKGLHTAPYLSMALAVSNKGKMTVNSGNYTTKPTAAAEGYNQGTSHGSWCAGVMNSGGELIINGGTFANGNFGDDALATNARGLIFGDTASNIVINDGTFNALKTIIDYQNNLGVQPNPNIVINGGNFSANPAVVTSYGGVVLAEGKVAAQGADGRWTLVDGVMDEAGLKAAFEKGGNIVLGADITVSETVTLAEGKTAVLNLNGKTLSAVDMNTIKNNGGNLTIKNGTVTRTGDVVGYSVNNASGEIAVENATIERGLYTSGSKMTATNANISHNQSSRHAIYAWNCAVTINSGTFHNDNAGNATLMASGSSIVTINGGTFSIADGRSSLGWTSSMIDQNSTAQVIVKGGLFNGGFRINSADTTLTIEGGEFNTNNGSAFTDYSGTKVVKGGKFTDAGAQNWAKKYIAEGYEMNANGEVVAK